ncbi:MAG: nickel-dependent lactate racemase [Firmicutes bacterium]|nr:nickel-dependent lactate racemase [Bacillota bacterium]
MRVEVGYGTGSQTVDISGKSTVEILRANEVNIERRGAEAVDFALRNPVGLPEIGKVIRPGEKIAVVTSDISRPMPTWVVMPCLLDALYEAGAAKEDITLVFALGSHRNHTEEEMRRLAGERAYSEIKCVDSDPTDCVRLGVTERGTPVDITRVVAEADRRICLGNIEYHYFAGYSGGAKAIMPGVSTPAAIQANHSMMVNDKACAGNLEDNPIRQDIEEAAALCGIDYIVNVVLDEHKEIVFAVAGDVTEAHREGCRFLDGMYEVSVEEKADIVIVSQGGAPKDANMYQTQKALDNAGHAVRPGGTIILVGACNEGMGSALFEEWMTEAKNPEDIVERIEREFRLGGHKAAAIAKILEYADIKLVSMMDEDFVRNIFMEPYDNLDDAYRDAALKYGDDARIIVMPYGGATLPRIRAAGDK